MYQSAREAVADCQKLWKWLAETGSPYKSDCPDPVVKGFFASCPLCEWLEIERSRKGPGLDCMDCCPLSLALGVTCVETVFGDWDKEEGLDRHHTKRRKLLARQFLDSINQVAKIYELPPVEASN